MEKIPVNVLKKTFLHPSFPLLYFTKLKIPSYTFLLFPSQEKSIYNHPADRISWMFFECSSFFPSFRSFHAREREKKKENERETKRVKFSRNDAGTVYGNCYIVSSFFIKRRWFRFVCLIRKSDDEHQHEKTLTTTGKGNKNTVAFIQFEFGATLSRARDTSYLPIRNSIFIKLSQKFLSRIFFYYYYHF